MAELTEAHTAGRWAQRHCAALLDAALVSYSCMSGCSHHWKHPPVALQQGTGDTSCSGSLLSALAATQVPHTVLFVQLLMLQAIVVYLLQSDLLL